MARVHVFADESGNFDFSRKTGASKYFILTTVTAPDWACGEALSQLRREMSWEGYDLPEGFHARYDPQPRRARVFTTLASVPFRVDATILEKAKAMPKLRPSAERFYQYAWWLHFKYVAPRIVTPTDELHVVAASIETRAKRERFHRAVKDVVQQVAPVAKYRTGFWQASTEPCLQAADYMSWAIARKWEGGDSSAMGYLSGKLMTEFDVFKPGRTQYY